VCGNVNNPSPSIIPGGSTSVWSWAATLQNVPDGILTIKFNKPGVANGVRASLTLSQANLT
jgi:alpha-1,3-glucan synthase